jgi:hypothetical protein
MQKSDRCVMCAVPNDCSSGGNPSGSPGGPSPSSGCTEVAMWGQCGGRSSAVGADASDKNVCCAWGGSCQRVNEWYYQCQPWAPRWDSGCGRQLTMWEQCGGINSGAQANATDPNTCCAYGR